MPNTRITAPISITIFSKHSSTLTARLQESYRRTDKTNDIEFLATLEVSIEHGAPRMHF